MVHRTNIKHNKKGIALETAVALILIAISLAIAIVLIFTTGMISSIQTVICTTLTTGASWIRGFLIHWLWILYAMVIMVVGLVMLAFGSTCQNFPIGSAICLAAFAIFTATLAIFFDIVTSGIPMLYCPNPTIMRAYDEGLCGDYNKGISNVSFFREVADRSVDCWFMYTAGEFDPLTGIAPPNPITCSVISFKLKQPVTINQMIDYMKGTNYSSKKTYWDEIGSEIVTPQPNIDRAKTFEKGRIFIKYGDNLNGYWGSEDCQIDSDWDDNSATNNDRVYWCFEKEITCAYGCANFIDGGSCIW